MRRRFLDALVVLAALLASLAALEGLLWLVAPPPRPTTLPPHIMRLADGVWTLTPGFRGVMDNRIEYVQVPLTVDAEGRRITPAAQGLEGAARRLFVLGDSQTFGHGLPDDATWANVLQARWRQGGRDVRVENWGVPGINIDQYRRRLAHVLAAAQPGDGVLVGMSWNDLITPQAPHEVMQVVEGYLVRAADNAAAPAKSEAGAAGAPAPASEQAVVASLRFYEKTGIVVPPFEDLRGFLSGLSRNSALASLTYRSVRSLYYRFRPPGSPLEQVLAADVPKGNMMLLHDMRRMAEERGVRLAVLLLPDKHFFEDASFAVYSAGGRLFAEQNAMGAIARPLCDAFGLDCLDAFGVLHAHQSEGMAFPIDGHYNARGAQRIGEMLAEALAWP